MSPASTMKGPMVGWGGETSGGKAPKMHGSKAMGSLGYVLGMNFSFVIWGR